MSSTTPASSPTLIPTPATPASTVLEAQQWRYATKAFDPVKKLSHQQWEALEQTLILTPSSYGLQPWKFVVVSDAALRAQLRPFSWDQEQVTDASHFVVFAARSRISEDDIRRFIKLVSQTRGVPLEKLAEWQQLAIDNLVKRMSDPTAFDWAARQCYIALGNLMTSAALMGIDTCPLEGIDPDAYDTILGLPETGFKTVVACAVGYRSSEDKYAIAKKVRFSAEEVLVRK